VRGYLNKKIKFIDVNKYEYIGTAIEYESKVDAGNGICGELFVELEFSSNPERKKGQSWSFLENEIEKIETIEE